MWIKKEMHPLWWLQGVFQRWGVFRRTCGAVHEGESVPMWDLWEALQNNWSSCRACGAVHEGGCSSVMFVGSTSKIGNTWECMCWCSWRVHALLWCLGKDCSVGDYLKEHIRTVHKGVLPTILFVLLFIYYIGGVKTYLQQLESECDFCDATLVCNDGHNRYIIDVCIT